MTLELRSWFVFRAPLPALGVGLLEVMAQLKGLYVKAGYIPDGSGVWFRDQPWTLTVLVKTMMTVLSARLNSEIQ